jgi:uncharacterized protein
MSPFYFGPPHRRLFGVLHAHEDASAPRGGVLLIMPFGHEAIRTHRFHRMLAERLTRLGFDVLRFDHYGSGDSDGLDADVRLTGWSTDIVTASQTLTAMTGRPVSCWAGSRLGASAAIGALAAPTAPSYVALWDPIIDGAAYLDSLRTLHLKALSASFNKRESDWGKQASPPGSRLNEAIGFAISAELHDAVLSLSSSTLRTPARVNGVLVCNKASPGLGEWLLQQGGAWDRHPLDVEFDWTSDDSLNTALVPAQALACMVSAVDGCPG